MLRRGFVHLTAAQAEKVFARLGELIEEVVSRESDDDDAEWYAMALSFHRAATPDLALDQALSYEEEKRD